MKATPLRMFADLIQVFNEELQDYSIEIDGLAFGEYLRVTIEGAESSISVCLATTERGFEYRLFDYSSEEIVHTKCAVTVVDKITMWTRPPRFSVKSTAFQQIGAVLLYLSEHKYYEDCVLDNISMDEFRQAALNEVKDEHYPAYLGIGCMSLALVLLYEYELGHKLLSIPLFIIFIVDFKIEKWPLHSIIVGYDSASIAHESFFWDDGNDISYNMDKFKEFFTTYETYVGRIFS